MEHKEVFFSVVIPTYNRADYVNKTIRSLLLNEYPFFEIIVVDDGSQDNTETVVSQIDNKRVKYFRKNNGERGAARNFGAQLAKGDYINFFDSDDVAYLNHFLEANDAVRRFKGPEVFHLGYDVKDGAGRWIRNINNLPFFVNDCLIDGNHLSCNGVFLRKDICNQFPFEEDRILSASEDYELWLRLAARFPFHNVKTITSTVINHEARSVLKINLERFLARMDCLQKNLRTDSIFISRYGSKWSLFQSYLNIYIALHLAMANYSLNTSSKYLTRAVSLNPRVLFTRRFLSALKNCIL